MLEASAEYSVGRGTDSPFEQIGAPWIEGRTLAEYLNDRKIPGVRIYPTRFRPDSSQLAGEEVEGIRFLITDREALNSSRLGIEVVAALLHLFPGGLDLEANQWLIGSQKVISALERGDEPSAVLAVHSDQREAFLRVRDHYLLYR